MAFEGSWTRSHAENGVELLQLIGIPKPMIQVLGDVIPVLTLTQDESGLEEILSMGLTHNAVTIKFGQKSTITQWNGETADTVPELIHGKKYIMKYTFEGHDYVITREVTKPDELLDTIDLDGGKVVARFRYTK